MKTEVKFKNSGIEIGLYTLGDISKDPLSGRKISAEQRMKEIIAAAKLADEAGLDLFGVGEHHRLDYAVSATPVMLAAISQQTKQIKLTSATTVLSTVDPVRLYEDFATLDLLSGGRAEIIAGRGAFLESFPLFGFDTKDYDALFSENIDLFLQLNKHEQITWEGRFRSSLHNAEIAPRPLQREIPIWIGVGGTKESAVRAGHLGVGMAVVILDGDPSRFQPLVDIYHKAGLEAGHDPQQLQVAVTGHGYIAKTSKQAKEEFYPYYAHYKESVYEQRGMEYTLSRADYDQMVGADSALFVGSPEEIAEKILRQYELFHHQRFIAQIDIGGIPFEKVAKGIELLATEVAPIVRKATSR